ncbi:hypothetical protein GCM10011390_07350 [Aureimonas endophytica]|uniref:Calycin-like beta-barrel protein n=1 Tax=Aureimonas endophytica TaxID=2027858 RepID=A0A916ZE10_9HYPH|nr:hypothetical protein [Aureimonas endophytica]GGD91153.1 hypothetical protein GCM10011390_07350 [Aureimonas endophytica]
MIFVRAGLGLALLVSAVPAASADPAFLERFEGGWRGSGFVQRDVDKSPRRVSCRVSGSRPAENRLSIAGTCRAAVVFTRQIGADLRYDPGSQRFSGTYTGSSKGPARVAGTQRGDALVLTITYPVPTYGDRVATMVIRNAGAGRFSMVVVDKVDGADKETSNIDFGEG